MSATSANSMVNTVIEIDWKLSMVDPVKQKLNIKYRLAFVLKVIGKWIHLSFSINAGDSVWLSGGKWGTCVLKKDLTKIEFTCVSLNRNNITSDNSVLVTFNNSTWGNGDKSFEQLQRFAKSDTGTWKRIGFNSSTCYQCQLITVERNFCSNELL